MNEYLIALIVMSAVITTLVIDNIVIRIKRRRVASQVLQLALDKVALLNEIGKLTEQTQSKEIEQTDGFLKFVSESRDWAFSYIEEVQDALKAFDKKMGPLLEYSTTYGSVVPSHLDSTIEMIDAAYKDLLKVLPKETDN
jgi:hypothetical protein